MGIALGYAFLLAIAGGLAAICVAHWLELSEEMRAREGEEPARGASAPARLTLDAAPSIVPDAGRIGRLPRVAGALRAAASSRLPLTPK